MKPLLLSCGLLCMICAQSQNSYTKIKLAFTVGGTSRELKSAMVDQGFDLDDTGLFGSGNIEYPQLAKYPSASLEWGKHLNNKTSISVLGGLQEWGQVEGHNGSTVIKIQYASWVVNPRFNFHPSSSIVGLGPSALLLRCKRSNKDAGPDYSDSKLVPGLSLSAETMLKTKDKVGVGLFASLNLYRGVDIKPIEVENGSQNYFESNINPSGMNIGFFIQF